MTAGKYNFLIEQGSTWNQTLNLTDDLGNVTDLTSYTAGMKIKSSYTASTSILDVSSYITVTGSSGLITISVPNTVTSSLDFDSAVYDLELYLGSVTTRLLEGSVNLSKEVTR